MVAGNERGVGTAEGKQDLDTHLQVPNTTLPEVVRREMGIQGQTRRTRRYS